MHIIFELEAFDTQFTPCIHVSRSIGKGMNADGLSPTYITGYDHFPPPIVSAMLT